MSWMNSGQKRNARKARNFTHKPAQARLDEQLAPFRNQIENALNVDAVDVVIFRRSRLGIPCSCSKHQIVAETVQQMIGDTVDQGTSESQQISTPTNRQQGDLGSKVTFDLGTSSIFGEGVYDRDTTRVTKRKSNEMELGDFAGPVGPAATPGNIVTDNEEQMFLGTEFEGGGENCGICYREGFQPAFELVNYKYQLLSHYNITAISGYHQDHSLKPLAFLQEDPNGYIEYSITVPKYFVEVNYSIRDNGEVFKPTFRLYTGDNQPLTRAYVDAHRGREMLVRIRTVNRFTHGVILFKLLVDDVKGNLNEEQDMINYENETTIGDLNVVLPAVAGSIRSGDFLVIPKRNMVLKVNGAPRRTTAKREIWEWSLTCRAVQRSEFTSNIFKNYKLF